VLVGVWKVAWIEGIEAGKGEIEEKEGLKGKCLKCSICFVSKVIYVILATENEILKLA